MNKLGENFEEKPRRNASHRTLDVAARQRRFVDEYLIDLNATKAAIRAGYSARSARVKASELLKLPRVAVAVEAALAARSQRTGITQDYVMANLVEVVERCMQRAPVLGANDEEGRSVWRFDSKGANGALAMIARHLGMFADPAKTEDADGPGDNSRDNPNPRAITAKMRTRVMERDRFRCRRCGHGPDTTPLVVDHIIPVAKGGTGNESNLQTLCELCNAGKHDRDPVDHDFRDRVLLVVDPATQVTGAT